MKPEFEKIAVKLHELKKLGNTPESIEKIVHDLNLPLGLHLAIMGKFSDILSGKIFLPKILGGAK